VALPPVYLVDASIYIFRAWFSMSDEFVNQKGEPTNAVYGFSGFLCSLLEQTGAEHMAIAFDESLSKSYRNEIYPEYKANRDPMPEALRPQIGRCVSVLEAMGVPVLGLARYEADDVIATLARQAEDENHRVVVVTGDKDLMQLVSDRVQMYDPMRDKRYDRDAVIEKFGVPPELVADALALAGDPSDNIPGVKGIGEKGAAKLVAAYPSLEELLADADAQSARIAANLKAAADYIAIMQQIVPVRKDVAVAIDHPTKDDGQVAKLSAAYGITGPVKRYLDVQ